MSEHHEHDHEAGGHERGHPGSGRALTLISLAHGINHGQSALKPLVYPLVLIQLGFGYAELGIMLGVASAVGGSLQLMAGGLGRFVKRHLLLGLGNAFVGICFVLITIAQSFPQFFLWSCPGGLRRHGHVVRSGQSLYRARPTSEPSANAVGRRRFVSHG